MNYGIPKWMKKKSYYESIKAMVKVNVNDGRDEPNLYPRQSGIHERCLVVVSDFVLICAVPHLGVYAAN